MNSTRHSVECFRPLSGSYISQLRQEREENLGKCHVSVPYRGATFLNIITERNKRDWKKVSVPYRGATFLNEKYPTCKFSIRTFPSPIGELHFSIIYSWAKGECRAVSVPYRGATFLNLTQIHLARKKHCFRPLSGSYISQYHPRNPMSCLGRIGGLRGKSNFIEMQPFWKVKNSHKSSI